MTTSTYTRTHIDAEHEDASLDTAAPIVRGALAHAILLGVAADLLLRDGIDGVGFPIWIALLGLALLSLTWNARRELPRAACAWMLVALAAACGLAWRDSEMLNALDLIATAGGLAMAAIALGNDRAGLLAERFRDTVWAAASMIRPMIAGSMPLLANALRTAKRGASWESRSRQSLRSGLLALGVLVLFGSLLRAGDPIFASLVAAPDVDVGVAVSHAFLIWVFAWLVAGWTNAALGPTLTQSRAPDRLPFALAGSDLVASLGVLNALFGAFVLAQLGWLFGGERFLQERTGLTAAEYARHGFFEVVWVAALVVPMLVISRAALLPERDLARRHTLLSAPLLLLLGGIIVSAAARMQLYVRYYGLTVDRLYTLVFIGWLLVVLAWLGLTVLRDRGRTFIAGVVISGLVVLASLNVAAPDAIVARFNASRAQQDMQHLSVDLRHMTQLSADAVDVAIEATLAAPRSTGASRAEEGHARCDAADRLMRRWGPSSRTADRNQDDVWWRHWNAGERHALQSMRTSAPALRRVQQTACVNVPAAERLISRR